MPQASKQTKSMLQKISIESWLVIANIVITAALGFYLAIRNENLQRQLIDLQSQTKLASIVIEQGAYDPQSFDVSNQGFAVAENLKLVLCIDSVNLNLADKVDISQIYVHTDNTAIDFTIESNVRSTSCETLTLKTIVPRETIHFFLEARSTGQFSERIGKPREFFFVIPRKFTNHSLEELVRYAETNYRNEYYEYSLADVSIDASCSNCNVNDRINSLNISYPSMGAMSKVSETEQSETENYIKIKEIITYYYFPISGQRFPDTPLYLEVLSDSLGSDLKTISKQEYDALK